MYCTPPCVIHLLQALQVCVPAVHKSSRITLHHLSFLRSKWKPNDSMWPAVSAESTPYEVLLLTTGRPPDASRSIVFPSYTSSSLAWWAIP